MNKCFFKKWFEKSETEIHLTEPVSSISQSSKKWGDIIEGILKQYGDDQISISELMFNDYENIWIEREGLTEKVTFPVFEDEGVYINFAAQIARDGGVQLNKSTPFASVDIEGQRATIVWEPISSKQPIVTIRRFLHQYFSVIELKKLNFLTHDHSKIIEASIQAGHNILISGASSTGKTTLLSAMLNTVDSSERIVIIEDTPEIHLENIDQRNVFKLKTKSTKTMADNQRVTLRDLVKLSLRLNPKRMIIGEIRGEESLDFVEVMSTGHYGTIATIHSSSPKDALERLTTLVLLHMKNTDRLSLAKNIGSYVNLVVQLEKTVSGKRRIKEIVEVNGYDDTSRNYIVKGVAYAQASTSTP